MLFAFKERNMTVSFTNKVHKPHMRRFVFLFLGARRLTCGLGDHHAVFVVVTS